MARRLHLGFLILATLGLGACTFTQEKPVVAEKTCDKPTAVGQYLMGKYHELPIQGGESNKGGGTLVFVSRNGKTYTIVRIKDGCAVPLDAGHDWQRIILGGERT